MSHNYTDRTTMTLGWWLLTSSNGELIVCHAKREEPYIYGDRMSGYTHRVYCTLYYQDGSTPSAVYNSPINWVHGWSARPLDTSDPQDITLAARIRMGAGHE